MKIYDRIRSRREDLHLSQMELAESLGYKSRSSIAKIEAGVNDLPQSKISAFAEALETTPSYLMGWTDDPYDYDLDPDGRFDDIPLAVNDHLNEIYGDNAETKYKAWQAMKDSAQEETAHMAHELNDENLEGLEMLEEPSLDSAATDTQKADTLPSSAFEYNPTHRIPILGRISAGLPLYAEENIEGYTYTELNHGGEYFALRVSGDSMTAARINDGDLLIIRRQDIVENGEIAVVMVGDDEATVKCFYRDKNIVTLMPQSYNPAHKPQIYDLRETPIHILGKLVQNLISY